MATFKMHINSQYTGYLVDWIKDNYFQTMSTEVIQTVRAWKHKDEDMVIIHVDEAAMSIVEVDMQFWLGFHFCNHLVKIGLNPTWVL